MSHMQLFKEKPEGTVIPIAPTVCVYIPCKAADAARTPISPHPLAFKLEKSTSKGRQDIVRYTGWFLNSREDEQVIAAPSSRFASRCRSARDDGGTSDDPNWDFGGKKVIHL
jgi:hypothetical protein